MLAANTVLLVQNMFCVEGGNFLILQKINATFSWEYIVSVN